ncbi:MAG: hypothetical protein M1838_002196 [Thelocarpon superellum]|nr:MAG: hypothetical protein M1838_002196 [Thelocarpon superellum]
MYRSAKELPYELREHCVIYFEEELYSQGLSLLKSLVTAGNSTSDPSSTPAFRPPPQHLALAATLVVHPTLTTRAASRDRIIASNEALSLLRATLQVFGPTNANFRAAFAFVGPGGGRRGPSHRRGGGGDEDSPESEDNVDAINTELAKHGSLWSLGEDFWHVVGWALNCSVAHPHRWARWKLWLDVMLDILEQDWLDREDLAAEKASKDAGAESSREIEEIFTTSLIVKYLPTELGRYGGNRRVVRAIFADGSAKSMNEFKEVFRNETKEIKKDADTKRNRASRVNVDEEHYGDYFDDDVDDDIDDVGYADDASRPPTGLDSSEAEVEKAAPRKPDDASTCFGDLESILLRQRLLALLSSLASTLPTHFTTLESLYSTYVEHLRPLDLPTFSLFTSPTMLPYISSAARSSMTQLLLRSLISSTAPFPRQPPATPSSTSTGPQQAQQDDLSQETLEQCFLPYSANTSSVMDNAKVSLLVEALLRLLDLHVGVTPTPALRDAVERGIRAREARAKPSGRRREDVKRAEDLAGVYLKASAARLRAFVELLCSVAARDGDRDKERGAEVGHDDNEVMDNDGSDD